MEVKFSHEPPSYPGVRYKYPISFHRYISWPGGIFGGVGLRMFNWRIRIWRKFA